MKVCWDDIELRMTSSENVRHAIVYTPERAVCVEPQSCAIDAFNLDAAACSMRAPSSSSPAAARRIDVVALVRGFGLRLAGLVDAGTAIIERRG